MTTRAAVRLLEQVVDEPGRTPLQRGAVLVALAVDVACEGLDVGERSWALAIAERIVQQLAAELVPAEAERLLLEAAA